MTNTSKYIPKYYSVPINPLMTSDHFMYHEVQHSGVLHSDRSVHIYIHTN